MMQKNTFMRKHRNSSCYHFRVRIPLDLQKHFKDKKNFTISLRTGVYRDASRTATRLYTLSKIISVCLSPEIKGAIWSLSTQMKCSPEETLEMSIREHFSLPRPQRWMRESWVQGGVVIDWGKECWVKTLSEQTHRVMPPEVSAWDENVELRNIGLSQQVWVQLHSIGRQKEASPLETLEMNLRQHFGLTVPEKWKIDSWIQSGVVYEYSDWTDWPISH